MKSVNLVQIPESGEIVAISGSHDQTVMMNTIAKEKKEWKFHTAVLGRGHAGSVDCVEASPNLQRV